MIKHGWVLPLLCVLMSGCRHSPAATSGVIHLQDTAGYPLLLPSGTAANAATMVETPVRLGVPVPSDRERCSIAGSVFALTAPQGSDVWTVRSPSMSGWQDATITEEFREAWIGFVHELAVRQRAGCFPAGGSAPLRLIAEAIAVPADEALLFRYGFTGRGGTDLLPGMVIEAEHSYVRPNKGGRRELQSSVARYHVVAASQGGVALRQTYTEHRNLAGDASILFHLHEKTAGTSYLRLFLQYAGQGSAKQSSLLLSSTDALALDRVSGAIEAAGAPDCKADSDPAVHCLLVEAAVSLLIECRLDGKPVLQPLGTTLGQLLHDRDAVLPAVKIRRRLSSGAWNDLDFPHTTAAAGRLVLVDGDEVTMR